MGQLSFADVDPLADLSLRETTFVVVDLETTGGRASGEGHDSITEIGAVKVRGGAVLGELATLSPRLAQIGLGRRRRVDVDGYSHGRLSLLLGCVGRVDVVQGLADIRDGCVSPEVPQGERFGRPCTKIPICPTETQHAGGDSAALEHDDGAKYDPQPATLGSV